MRLIVEQNSDSVALLEFLSEHLIGLSKTRLRRMIGEGKVTVNGHRVSSGWTVRTGDEVMLDSDDLPEPDFSGGIAPQVLFEDEHHLVVNKPTDCTVLPDRAGGSREFFNGLVQHLNPDLGALGRYVRPHVVHRLDRETSGVLIVAKNTAAGRALAMQFEAGKVRKTYLAIMEGIPPEDEFTIELPIAREKTNVLKMTVDFKKGRRSVTVVKVVGRFLRFSLVEVYPKTGRQHQIRLHASAIGYPLAVDFLYGRRRQLTLADVTGKHSDNETVLLERCPLHAACIEYFHPASGARMRFDAPLPEDMQNALNMLKQVSRGRR